MALSRIILTVLSFALAITMGIGARLEMDQSQEHRHVSRHIHNEPSNEMRVVSLPLTGRKEAQEMVEPQKLEMKSETVRKEHYLANFLADMKTGTKVFQHFLSKSNLSDIVEGKQSPLFLYPHQHLLIDFF